MNDPALRKNSLALFFVIAYAIPIIATIAVALVAGLPSDIVVRELSAATLIVVVAMVHAPAIAAIIVVFRSQGFQGITILFRQLKHWKFALEWYLKAVLIFPATMLAVLFALSLFSANYTPVLSLSVMAFGALLSSLFEEIGWTGFATPVMLNRFSPFETGLFLGSLHAMWHLAASVYGASAFHGNLFVVNFLATSVGIVGLRIITIWIYTRTQSLVLGWLMHAGFTGGQLSLVPLDLTAAETIAWNAAFTISVIGVAVIVVLRNRDLMLRQSGQNQIEASFDEGASQP